MRRPPQVSQDEAENSATGTTDQRLKPAAGVESIFPGPYLCYHGEPIQDDVQRAHDFVIQVVREEGPFDGVLGFSQGAALAAAVIAAHAEENPSEELFKIAVFIATSMPFDLKGGKIRLTYEGSGSLSAARVDGAGHVVANEECDWLNDCRTASVIREFEGRQPRIRQRQGPQTIDVLLRYHPSTHTQRIQIPTVHVVGAKDSYREQGMDLASLCSARKAQMVAHQGGHEMPRDAATVARAAEAIYEAVERMRLEN